MQNRQSRSHLIAVYPRSQLIVFLTENFHQNTKKYSFVVNINSFIENIYLPVFFFMFIIFKRITVKSLELLFQNTYASLKKNT